MNTTATTNKQAGHREAIVAWHDSLDQFTQGHGALRPTRDTFCCLGGLCEVAIEHGVALRVQRLAGQKFTYNGAEETLPEAVQAWAGLDHSNPVLFYGHANHSAARLNDGPNTGQGLGGLNFTEIKRAIRQTWPEFFTDRDEDGNVVPSWSGRAGDVRQRANPGGGLV